MPVTDKASLIQYILGRLGEPVIKVNVSPNQIEDRIDDAMQFMVDYHDDFTKNEYMKYEVSAQDIVNEFIQIPNDVYTILNIFPIGGFTSNNREFDPLYTATIQTLNPYGAGNTNRQSDLLHIEVMRQYRSLLNTRYFNNKPAFNFVRIENKLHIEAGWGTDIKEGDLIAFEVLRVVDADLYQNILNDRHFKDLATECVRLQWGTNLSKFDGVQLVGGQTLNGRQMYDDAEGNIREIKEAIKTETQKPLGIFMG